MHIVHFKHNCGVTLASYQIISDLTVCLTACSVWLIQKNQSSVLLTLCGENPPAVDVFILKTVMRQATSFIMNQSRNLHRKICIHFPVYCVFSWLDIDPFSHIPSVTSLALGYCSVTMKQLLRITVNVLHEWTESKNHNRKTNNAIFYGICCNWPASLWYVLQLKLIKTQ